MPSHRSTPAPIVLLGNLDQVEQRPQPGQRKAQTQRAGSYAKTLIVCLLVSSVCPEVKKLNGSSSRRSLWTGLKEKYRDNLRCVVEHQDETHPHLHFYCVAKIVNLLTTCTKASEHKKELKKQNPQATKKDQNLAFSEAMRATQDDFANRVGQRFGLARIGPGRRRLTRAEWKAEQAQAEALKNTLAKKMHTKSTTKNRQSQRLNHSLSKRKSKPDRKDWQRLNKWATSWGACCQVSKTN